MAFDVGDERFGRLVDEFLAHKWLSEDMKAGQLYFRLHHAQALAFKEAWNKNYEKAASISLVYLDVDVDGLDQDEKLAKTPLSEMTHEHIQQVARDYRDLGNWLLHCDIPNKEAQALKVWKRGLEVPDIFGNRRFLTDLNELVEKAS